MKAFCLFALLITLSIVSAERYIITYEDDAWHALHEDLPEHTVYILKNLKMSVADLSDDEVFMYESIPGVTVEKDQEVHLFEDYPSFVETNATWGIDRIDQAALPLDGLYHFNTTASDVDIWVVDTGVIENHTEFGGRAKFEQNFAGDSIDKDCNGHGTHVSSTIAGTWVGVAKGARLHGVKVLTCAGSGSYAGVLAGIDWVAGEHSKVPGRKSVINMSIGGPISKAVNDAVTAAHNAGINVVVAAGNSNANACLTSPASAADAITVAASDKNDVSAVFTNHGKCVTVYAPGVDIHGAFIPDHNTYRTLSGTSMASPHTAGVAALLLSSGVAHADVKATLAAHAVKDALSNVPQNTPNLLLHVNLTHNTTTTVNKVFML